MPWGNCRDCVYLQPDSWCDENEQWTTPDRGCLYYRPKSPPAPLPYVYRWDRQGRKGQPCKVTARGTMNSCRVEFPDGYVMISSRNAIRKAATPADPALSADAAHLPSKSR